MLPRDLRPAAIEAQLVAAFPDSQIQVRDDSHKHIGHEGAKDGRGHFHIQVISTAFIGKRPLARHRMLYAALEQLMQSDIHALSIQALSPEEAQEPRA